MLLKGLAAIVGATVVAGGMYFSYSYGHSTGDKVGYARKTTEVENQRYHVPPLKSHPEADWVLVCKDENKVRPIRKGGIVGTLPEFSDTIVLDTIPSPGDAVRLIAKSLDRFYEPKPRHEER